MGILGWGLGSLPVASIIYHYGSLKFTFSAIAIMLMNSWEEPYDYRFTYLKWLMILLLVPAIAYVGIFFSVSHPISLKLPYLAISLFFVAALFSRTLKAKKDLGF